MKKLILAALIAAAGLFAGVNTAEAGNYYNRYNHCAPKIYTVNTYEINRCKHKKVNYDHCGRVYYSWYTVVTYKTVYSNGTWRTFTRTFYS